MATTDKTPTIYGKITDPLAGGDSSQTQSESGPKVASAPKEVNIKVEKKTGSAIASATQKTVDSAKDSIANTTFKIGEKAQDVSDTTGFVIVKFGYLFVNEPTKIANVQVATLSSTSVKVSWETNHPANGKVNYGLDRTYSFDIQSEKRVTHHEFNLTDLQPDTTYYFEVMSHNKNYVYDANREFKTSAK